MVVALFGPPGQWIQNLNFATSEPADFVRVDEAAVKGKRRRERRFWYYWWELEEMFGQKAARDMFARGQIEKKMLKNEDDMYRILKDGEKPQKRQQDEDYHTPRGEETIRRSR